MTTGAAPAAALDGEYEALLASADPMAEFPDFDENTRATTFYSTGTTGMPKGVYFSHRQLVLHTLATIATLGTAVTQGRFHQEDVYMPLTPMFHVHAWGIPYVATMLGVKQVYPGKYVPEILLKLIVEEKVTFSHCVPTILNMLVSSPAAAAVNLSGWKVLIGGSALPRSVAIAALKRGVDVSVGYGLSESCPVLTLSQLGTRGAEAGNRGAGGPALPYREALRAGQTSRSSMRRVTKSHLTTSRAARSWCALRGSPRATSRTRRTPRGSGRAAGCTRRTLPAETQSGSIRITDRAKDIIKVGGEWLSSLELEDILSTHPAVAESAVVGQADLTWGEVPVALVVLKKDQKANGERAIRPRKDLCGQGRVAARGFSDQGQVRGGNRENQRRQDQQGGAAGEIPGVDGAQAPLLYVATGRLRGGALSVGLPQIGGLGKLLPKQLDRVSGIVFNRVHDFRVHFRPLVLQRVVGLLVHQRHVHVHAELPGESVKKLVSGEPDDLGVKLAVKLDGPLFAGVGRGLGGKQTHLLHDYPQAADGTRVPASAGGWPCITAYPSSASRTAYTSRIILREGTRTRQALRGLMVTTPSNSSLFTASRTGMLLTASSAATLLMLIASP